MVCSPINLDPISIHPQTPVAIFTRLIFGAFSRVVYFFGVLASIGLLASAAVAVYSGGRERDICDIAEVWGPAGEACRRVFGANFGVPVFTGLWLGAASQRSPIWQVRSSELARSRNFFSRGLRRIGPSVIGGLGDGLHPRRCDFLKEPSSRAAVGDS